MLRIQSIALPENGRVIVISDIHGDLQLLQALLEQVHYTPDDTLIINGDLCERGPNSLGVIRFAKKLTEESNHTYITEGNCDRLIHHVFDQDPTVFEHLARNPHSIMNEWLHERGKKAGDFDSVSALSDFYRKQYGAEIDWLFSFPAALETDRYLFIHAGIEDRSDWGRTSHKSAVALPHFYTGSHQCMKTVVVGHWPVVNYRSEAVTCHNPIIDPNKRMICIDGGNQIRVDGQLNALIIHRHPQGDKITWTYVDHFHHYRSVKKDYQPPNDFVGTLNYPNYQVKLLRPCKHFSLCENINLGLKQWIKNEYLESRDDGLFASNDVSATGLAVAAHDRIAVIDDTCSGYTLVKKNGTVGWIPNSVL
ncbi:metallophosphoesterase [Sporolactobacillus sp. CPB3-1]|uniref:Metallophosphoesterase n=1 Tax=Sporolactobacillus mangiferae TaxID=2940498 RepID=A0ABT0M9W5_9BACL|nr:metallophosphoesterase [Sporolactobacillus mangiferae]MCL1631671.1 metallophosphoesterase [Sporolactobacillus mangiferae]